MRSLAVLLFSSSLVLAAPRILTQTEVVTVTTTVYADATSAYQAPPPAKPSTNASSPSPKADSPSPPAPSPSSSSPAPPAPAAPSPVADVKQKDTGTSLTTDSTLRRMSLDQINAIYKTCHKGEIVWPSNDMPPPVLDNPSTQASLYTIPPTTSNKITIHNYCAYDIYYNHVDKDHSIGTGTLKAGGTFQSDLAGTVWKASKSPSMAKDLLVEYSIDANGNLWYNLSLITCLGKTNGLENKDTSACAGHEGGLQLGNQGSLTFQCAPGTWCDDQAYFYHENLCKQQNPVRQCNPSLGLTMEFCAGNKK